MISPRRAAATVAAAAALVVGPALAATAITGGDADLEKHPNVAMIGFYDPTGRYRCSASLVSPTVLLTAAHCTDGVVGKVAVTFDTFVAAAPPSPLPTATNPAGGYTPDELEAAGYLSGEAETHPDYSGFTDLRNWNDVGVVVLDEPVDIKPVNLAPLNYLDTLTQPRLNKTIFEVVGYGTEVRKAESGPQKPTPMSYPLLRRVAYAPGQKLTPQILQLNGNEKDNRGTGGSCFGDSGGPTFHSHSGTHTEDEVQVTVTSYGYTSNCRYLDGMQRVDIPVVQDWLATFGVKPAAE